jgi:hypothetical protein
MKQVEDMLRAFFSAVLDECDDNPEFAKRIARALRVNFDAPHGRREEVEGQRGAKRSGRRRQGQFDPFELYAEGEDVLKQRLQKLDETQLKDIIAEHSMDNARLARRWKDRDRLVQHIIATVVQRTHKGEVFMDRAFKLKVSEARFVRDWDAVLVPVEFVNRGAADTVTSIELRIGGEALVNSVPHLGREVDRVLEPPPLRLEDSDGRTGVLYFVLFPRNDGSAPRLSDAELVVRLASGEVQRRSVTIHGPTVDPENARPTERH